MTEAPYMTMSAKRPSTTSWCGMSKRTEILITGYLTLVYTAAFIISVAVAFVWIGILTDGFDGWTTESQTIKYLDREIQKCILAYYAAIMIFLLLVNVCSLTLNIICLVGIHKRRPNLMHWYVSFASARMLISVAALASYLLVGFDTGVLMILIFDIVFAASYMSSICSYSRQLKQEAVENMKNEKNEEIFKIPVA